MSDFRKITPKRRECFPQYKRYTQYKSLLQEDFHHRCGYCGDHDYFSKTFYEIDHFVPKKHTKLISETEYSNLVYSCRSCNNSKRAKWPTGNEDIHNDGEKGFIDPCDKKYPEQFERIVDGSIHPKTILGKWMWENLKFASPNHRIIWCLEQLREAIDKIVNSKEVKLTQEMSALAIKYFKLENIIKGKPRFD